VATGGGATCLFARSKLAQFTQGLKESSGAEKAGTLVKVGYLASIKTTERNVGGNLTFGLTQFLAQRPLAVGMDYLQAVMRSAAKFGKVPPSEYRQIANTLNVGGLKRGAYGIRNGIHEAAQLMRTGIDPSKFDNSQLKFDLVETNFKNPVLDRATKFVFNSLEAQDKPFYGFAFQTSLYGRARLMAIREGLSRGKLSPRIDEILENPSEEMILGAHADAQYATFKNRTTLSDMATSLRQSARSRLAQAEKGHKFGPAVASLAMDITIPFTKVASAITMAGVDYSPFGALKLIAHAMDPDPRIQAQLVQQLSKATIGTGLTMVGYAMYGNGTMTGSAPTEKSQRKIWDAENKQANSIKINGRWRSITWLGPLAIPMLLGANIRRFSSEDEEKSATDIASFGLGSIGKTMTEQSYLQGISNLIGAFSETDSRAASAFAGMIPVPSIVGQIATAVDPTARETHTVREKVQAKIPFASRSLPARLDPFGQEIQKTPGGIRGAAESLLDFTNPKTDASTALTRELERLKIGLSAVSPSYQAGGEKIQRSQETIRELTKEIGPEYRNKLEELIRTKSYNEADDEQRGKMLRRAMDQVKKPVYNREKLSGLEDRIKSRLEARAAR
jgi:hypothetical protein